MWKWLLVGLVVGCGDRVIQNQGSQEIVIDGYENCKDDSESYYKYPTKSKEWSVILQTDEKEALIYSEKINDTLVIRANCCLLTKYDICNYRLYLNH